MIKLSISIPTYNRGDLLYENITNIIPQIKDRNNVELIICDNASNDNTQKLIPSIVNNYNGENLVYKRYDEFVSGRENFKRAVDLANGEYVLLMGDDDILSPDFVNIAINLLEKNKDINFIHFNRIYGPEDFRNNKLFDFRLVGTTIQKYKVVDFIEKYLASPSFMSSIIFKRDCWYKGKNFDKQEYYGYEWLSQILFGSIDGDCIYYYFPLVMARNSYRPWESRWPLYGFIGLSNMFNDLSKYNVNIEIEWKKVLHDKRTFILTILCISKDKKFYNSIYKELIEHTVDKKEKLFIDLILFFPRSITLKVLEPLFKAYFILREKVFKKTYYKHLF